MSRATGKMDTDLNIICVDPACIENLNPVCNMTYLLKTKFKNILRGATVVCKDGLISCESGPAIINNDGRKVWLYQGRLHRPDGPVYEDPDCSIWAIFGKFHRIDGPAIKLTVGTLLWCYEGKMHRLDGPAYQAPINIISPTIRKYINDGGIHFDYPGTPKHLHNECWINGKRHHSSLPAILCNICPDQYWINGKLHRLNGPAVIYKSGRKDYYLEGKLIKQEGMDPATSYDAGKRPRDEQDMPEITISYFGNDVVTYAEANPTKSHRAETVEEPTEEEATAK